MEASNTTEERRCAAVFMVTVPPGITKPMGTCGKLESEELHHLPDGRGHPFVLPPADAPAQPHEWTPIANSLPLHCARAGCKAALTDPIHTNTGIRVDAPAQEQQNTEAAIPHVCVSCGEPAHAQHDPLESLARELLRLEDWRKELAKEDERLDVTPVREIPDYLSVTRTLQSNQQLCAEQSEAAYQRLREWMEGK